MVAIDTDRVLGERKVLAGWEDPHDHGHGGNSIVICHHTHVRVRKARE